jgi:hypothetical protein
MLLQGTQSLGRKNRRAGKSVIPDGSSFGKLFALNLLFCIKSLLLFTGTSSYQVHKDVILGEKTPGTHRIFHTVHVAQWSRTTVTRVTVDTSIKLLQSFIRNGKET